MLTPDAFLTELYVLIDDWYKSQPAAPPHPGPAAALSPSEVLTLAMFGQWAVFPSERAFWRYAEHHLRPLFPHLPTRPQFNRAVRHGQAQLTAVAVQVGRWLSGQRCPYEIIDGTGIPTRNVKRRGAGWLAGEATIGQCTRLGWYEGVRVLLCSSPTGAITGWGVGPANTNDRRLAETFFAERAQSRPALPSVGQPVAPVYLADRGFTGVRWEQHWTAAYRAVVVCPPEAGHRRRWPPAWRRWLAGRRQVVETVTDRLLRTFGLAAERPHTLTGLLARLAARIGLHNVCLWLNHRAGRPLLATADFLDW
jgi:hypothetical protein